MKKNRLKIYSKEKILIGTLKRTRENISFDYMNNDFRGRPLALGYYNSKLLNKRIEVISSLHPADCLKQSNVFFIFGKQSQFDKTLIPIENFKDILTEGKIILK